MRTIVRLSVEPGIFLVFGTLGHRYEVVDNTIELPSVDAEALLGGATTGECFEIASFLTSH